jgi:hypothetical protein
MAVMHVAGTVVAYQSGLSAAALFDPNDEAVTAPTMLPFSGLSGQRSSRARIFGRATDGVAASSR